MVNFQIQIWTVTLFEISNITDLIHLPDHIMI